MLRRFSVNFALLSIGLDGLVITIALAAAVQIRLLQNALSFAKYIPSPIHFAWPLYLIFPLAWVIILLLLSVYDGRRKLKFSAEITNLSVGSILAAVSMAGMLYLSYREVSRLLFVTFVSVAYLAMLLWRLVARSFSLAARSWPTGQRRVLIIGVNDVGHDLAELIRINPGFGLNLIGFLEIGPQKTIIAERILGNVSQASEVILKNQIDDVVITLPDSTHEHINQLVADLHRLPVKTWLIPDYFRLALHKAALEDFAGIPMLDLRAPALTEYQRLIKRGFDLLITILFMPVILIVMAAIAILIFKEDRAPIIFKQKRVGENGRLFDMFKFRTMVSNAEELQHLVTYTDDQGHQIHKSIHDPRITRVGRFLRRWSLDELPQTLNILRGEMSLVGPRPELPELVKEYEAWQLKRFAVPQGVTGWWQIHGRSDKPMHLHTEDDLYYVQNYTLLLDIQILVNTIGAVARGKGAF